MIGVIAKLTARPGSEEAFETAFLDMAAQVKANEPGNLLYQLTKSRTEPSVYKVLEVYADQAALEAHRASEHFKAGGRALRDHLGAPPEVEVLDAVE
jgi:quinol monooxygenase YgiN